MCLIMLISQEPLLESKGQYLQVPVVTDHVVRANMVNLGTRLPTVVCGETELMSLPHMPV